MKRIAILLLIVSLALSGCVIAAPTVTPLPETVTPLPTNWTTTQADGYYLLDSPLAGTPVWWSTSSRRWSRGGHRPYSGSHCV